MFIEITKYGRNLIAQSVSDQLNCQWHVREQIVSAKL
jgi:hypothetical protein